MVQLSHLYKTIGKSIALTIWTFVGKVMSLLSNTLSGFVIAFLSRSKHVLISWLQSLSTVILEPKKTKSVTVSIASPSVNHEVMGPDAMILDYWMLCIKPAYLLSSFTLIKRFSVPLCLLPLEWYYLYMRLLIFLSAVLIPASNSSSLAFCMTHSAHTLHKQGDKPCHTTFPILNQSIVLCPCLIVASWSAHRFLKRQVRGSGILISLRIFYSLFWCTQSKALV